MLTALWVFKEGWPIMTLIVVPVMFTGVYLVYYSYSEHQRLTVRSVD